MTIENITTAFRNQSFEELIKLANNHSITHKEKNLFTAICTNAKKSIDTVWDKFSITKDISENDFDWLMKLYTFVCLLELQDVFSHVKNGVDDKIKEIIDVNQERATKDFALVIGGEDVAKYSKLAMNEISSLNEKAKDFEEYKILRVAHIFKFFQDGGATIPSGLDIDSQKLADDLYKENLLSLIKTCLG
jgi:hypothetical protein